jgi:hypothetical protein
MFFTYAYFGVGKNLEILKRYWDRTCSACQKVTSAKALALYTYFYVQPRGLEDYKLGIVTHKEYWLVCDSCDAGQLINAREAKQRIKSGEYAPLSIPLGLKVGLVVLCFFIGLLILALFSWRIALIILGGSIIAVALPLIVMELRKGGIKGLLNTLKANASAPFDDKPISLFGSSHQTNSPILKATPKPKKCKECGLVNVATDFQCERCGMPLGETTVVR